MVGYLIPPGLLLRSTCNTRPQGRVLWGIVVYLVLPRLTSSGPHRPGDRLGPTSGGSIGSQGWEDLVHHLVLCAAVPSIHCGMAEGYGTL